MATSNNLNNETIYQMAVDYTAYCNKDISMSSYKHWSNLEHIAAKLNDIDKQRVFLCALALSMEH